MLDRFRADGGGVGPGRPPRRPLDLPAENVGDVGDAKSDFALGLLGGDATDEGRS